MRIREPSAALSDIEGRIDVHRHNPSESDLCKIRRRCNSCGGHGGANGVEETSEITLSVPRGAHDGFRIVMEEGDFWEQDGVRSDLIFIVKVQRHRTFERSESDLRMRTKVLLADALRGFPMEITRLDGSILSLYVSGVVSPEQRRIVPREGLFNNPDSEGQDLRSRIRRLVAGAVAEGCCIAAALSTVLLRKKERGRVAFRELG